MSKVVLQRNTPIYSHPNVNSELKLWLKENAEVIIFKEEISAPYFFGLTNGGWACLGGPIEQPKWTLTAKVTTLRKDRTTAKDNDQAQSSQQSQLDTTIKVEERHFDELKIYKVLGEEESLRFYVDKWGEKDPLDGVQSLQNNDWCGLYTQFLAEHTLGTVPYRWLKYSTANLMEVSFKNLNVAIISGSILYSGEVDGKEKARLVKEKLGNIEGPLIAGLGEFGKCALVQETEFEWELILPFNLLEKLTWTERRIVQFKKHEQHPLTDTWFDGERWRSWENDFDPTVLPDLSQPWSNS